MNLTYTGIRVRSLDRALQFYRKALGMRVVNPGRMDAGGIFVRLRRPASAQVLELDWYPPESRFHESYRMGSELDHLAFRSREVRSDFDRLISADAKVAVEPWDEGGYPLAFFREPDGIRIELIGVQRSRKARKARVPPGRRRRKRGH